MYGGCSMEYSTEDQLWGSSLQTYNQPRLSRWQDSPAAVAATAAATIAAAAVAAAVAAAATAAAFAAANNDGEIEVFLVICSLYAHPRITNN